MSGIPASEPYTPPFDPHEPMWQSHPRETVGPGMTLTPEQIARQAVEALRDGRLPARRWDQIEEALAVQNWQRAEDLLRVYKQKEPDA